MKDKKWIYQNCYKILQNSRMGAMISQDMWINILFGYKTTYVVLV